MKHMFFTGVNVGKPGVARGFTGDIPLSGPIVIPVAPNERAGSIMASLESGSWGAGVLSVYGGASPHGPFADIGIAASVTSGAPSVGFAPVSCAYVAVVVSTANASDAYVCVSLSLVDSAQ